jgi:hypothetical protein
MMFSGRRVRRRSAHPRKVRHPIVPPIDLSQAHREPGAIAGRRGLRRRRIESRQEY